MTFIGTYTALITPFLPDFSLDYPSLETLIDLQIEGGVQGIVLLGTTGEAPTLTMDEREQLLTHAIAYINKRTQVVVGTGSNCTATTVALSQQAEQLGADGLLVSTPYYNKPTQTGLAQHFTAVADAVNISIMLYNVPGRTAVNMTPATVLQLVQHPNITCVKEASGDINQMMEITRQVPEGVTVLSGDDSLTLPLIAVGGHGIVSVLSNLHPARITANTQRALDGDMAGARVEHVDMIPLMDACFIQTNPLPIKTLLAAKGLVKEVFRAPLCPMDEREKQQLLTTFGL